MKRVKAACICQVLHFQLKEGLEPDQAARMVRQEVEDYKRKLQRSGTRYKIVSEAAQADGSVMIEIIKQYNQSDVGTYLD